MTGWRSLITMSGIVLPVGSFVGITERLEELDPTEIARDLNGAPVVFRPLWPDAKWKVGLSASGNAVRWAPAFSKVRRGDPVTLHCRSPFTDVIEPGTLFTTLTRPPVPGSVKVRRLGDDEEIAIEGFVDGLHVSVTETRDEPLVVTYRPILESVLVSRGLTMPEIEGRLEWSLSFEEA